jgi:hypothetical protein
VRHTVFSSPLYHRGHLRSGQNISGTVKPGFPSEYFFSPKFSLCLDISRDVSTLLGHSRCFSMVLGRSRSRLGASFATLASVEAVEPDERPPLAPLQQIHERTCITNPLKRITEPDREAVGKRRSTTREERLQALNFEDNAREWQKNKKGEMVLKKPSRR